MNDKIYLIHEEDYIKHIDEKVMLYSFVKQLTHYLARMKPTRENESLLKMAKNYDIAADTLFDSWGIPKSYLVCDDKDDLAELMENELIEPEDAGYCACDETCCCKCGCYCEDCDLYGEAESCDDADDEADEDENIAEWMAELSSFVHSIFGDNVSVHIVLE